VGRGPARAGPFLGDLSFRGGRAKRDNKEPSVCLGKAASSSHSLPRNDIGWRGEAHRIGRNDMATGLPQSLGQVLPGQVVLQGSFLFPPPLLDLRFRDNCIFDVLENFVIKQAINAVPAREISAFSRPCAVKPATQEIPSFRCKGHGFCCPGCIRNSAAAHALSVPFSQGCVCDE
jgi:hypothetical protein